MTHSRLSPAHTKKDARQPYTLMMATTPHGATALPMRAAACVTPCEYPRLPLGTQRDMAAVAAGKVAPSPNPNNTRATSIDTSPVENPVNAVAPPQTMPQTISV